MKIIDGTSQHCDIVNKLNIRKTFIFNDSSSNSLAPARNEALIVTTGALQRFLTDNLEIVSESLQMQYTRQGKLRMRMKINETNLINNILPYIPHFEETDQKTHDRRKFFFVRS